MLLFTKAIIRGGAHADLFGTPTHVKGYVKDGHQVAPYVAIRKHAVVEAHKPDPLVEGTPNENGGRGGFGSIEAAAASLRALGFTSPTPTGVKWTHPDGRVMRLGGSLKGKTGQSSGHAGWRFGYYLETPAAPAATAHNPTGAERRAERQDRLDSRADKLRSEAAAHHKRSDAISERFHMGQPIILNHHSTKRALADRDKMDTAMRGAIKASDKAADIEAIRPSTAILTVDSDAPDQIRARIAKLEANHARMKQTNVLARKGDVAGLAAMGYGETAIASIMKPDWGKPGVPDYMLTNNSANIRRLKERLPKVEEAQAAEYKTSMVGDVKVEEDPEAQRLRLHFPGKPSADVIARLKSHGFRWAPSERAWQRQLTGSAKWAASQVLKEAA